MVITYPGHTTAAYQPYDIVLAKPMKEEFGKAFEKTCNLLPDEGTRTNVIIALINSWAAVSRIELANKAFEKTGYIPFSPANLLASPKINKSKLEDPEREPRARSDLFLITSTVVTSEEFLEGPLKEHSSEPTDRIKSYVFFPLPEEACQTMESSFKYLPPKVKGKQQILEAAFIRTRGKPINKDEIESAKKKESQPIANLEKKTRGRKSKEEGRYIRYKGSDELFLVHEDTPLDRK